jgi:hypothetical protein
MNVLDYIDLLYFINESQQILHSLRLFFFAEKRMNRGLGLSPNIKEIITQGCGHRSPTVMLLAFPAFPAFHALKQSKGPH